MRSKALEQRHAVQATLMRATIHIVSKRDYVLFLAGIRNIRRDWWLSVQRHQTRGDDMEKAAEALRNHLADGPRRQAELASALQDEGLVHLVRRYLRAFGPAALNDIGSWAGLPLTTLRPIVERMRLRRLRDEGGGELLDVLGAPLPDPGMRAPVRFLPTWDATLLVHARRTQILPERYRPLVFNTKTPHSVPTFLVDGAVAGTWHLKGERVELNPFEPLRRGARSDLEEEAARLSAFHTD